MITAPQTLLALRFGDLDAVAALLAAKVAGGSLEGVSLAPDAEPTGDELKGATFTTKNFTFGIDGKSYPARLAKKKWTFKEFLGLDEYTNILTKMFGDSESCPQVRNCRKLGKGQTCDMVTGCHGYHNASTYLDHSHAAKAAETLATHSFFGLLEAYNASVLLAAKRWSLEKDLTAEDFAQSRASASLKQQCSPSRVLRADPSACRYAFDR